METGLWILKPVRSKQREAVRRTGLISTIAVAVVIVVVNVISAM